MAEGPDSSARDEMDGCVAGPRRARPGVKERPGLVAPADHLISVLDDYLRFILAWDLKLDLTVEFPVSGREGKVTGDSPMTQLWICTLYKKIVRVEDEWVLICKNAQGTSVRRDAVR